MRSTPLLTLATLLLALGVPAAAQEREAPAARADTLIREDLPPEVAEEIVAFFNDPRTLHFSGRTRIPGERSVSGDVAVLGGPLVIAGRVEGRVVVINGSVELLPGAVVDGDLTVVGGEVTGLEGARVGGEVVTYSERLRYSHRGDHIVRRDRYRHGEREERDRDGLRRGQGSLTVSGGDYNRVEGLPVYFGPTVETGGSNPFRIRALAVYRTEEGPFLRTERWGHDVTAEQFFGGHRSFRVGAGVFSLVAPIEAWHLSDTENSLSTFLFHRDFRDHYERKGWKAFATLEPRGTPWSLTAEFRSEKHRSLPVGDPWSVFNNGDAWRPQPLVGEGRLNSVVGRAELDTRNDPDDPATGWLVRGEVEHAVDSDLERPAAFRVTLDTPPGFIPVPALEYGAFTRGLLDVRRYNRINADSRLNLRLLVGGALDGVLPPQRQHALGGEGSLPGYSLFQFDCGARFERLALRVPALGEETESFVPAYGCDRFALLQAEYRGRFDFHFDWRGHGWDDEDDEEDDDWNDGRSWDADLDWVLFMDAGRGWAGRRGRGEETAVDAGVGLLLDEFGVYAAIPLRQGGGVNLFVRLGSRF
ncbi:MAG TPA: polymer-forming cytoskeletal protein [Longimicrobiaceae bacterium]|nr:polymer-forming cytoskeletal protein [Longimicrobiaceae bacterium]